MQPSEGAELLGSKHACACLLNESEMYHTGLLKYQVYRAARVYIRRQTGTGTGRLALRDLRCALVSADTNMTGSSGCALWQAAHASVSACTMSCTCSGRAVNLPCCGRRVVNQPRIVLISHAPNFVSCSAATTSRTSIWISRMLHLYIFTNFSSRHLVSLSPWRPARRLAGRLPPWRRCPRQRRPPGLRPLRRAPTIGGTKAHSS